MLNSYKQQMLDSHKRQTFKPSGMHTWGLPTLSISTNTEIVAFREHSVNVLLLFHPHDTQVSSKDRGWGSIRIKMLDLNFKVDKH